MKHSRLDVVISVISLAGQKSLIFDAAARLADTKFRERARLVTDFN